MSEIIIISFVLVIDQLSKYLVAEMGNINLSIIPHFFYITYAENTGMAWSLLEGQKVFFCLAAAAAIGVMLYYLVTKNPSRLIRVSLALMIAGAAGNLIDRLVLGYVRDFLNFYIFGYDFPIFNVADSALCIGVALLILDSFLEKNDG